jgi:hypothetical protein
MKKTVFFWGQVLTLAATATILYASDVELQVSFITANQPRNGLDTYFPGAQPAIDGQDIYYIADYARNLYRHRNGVSSILVTNRDSRAPQITGFLEVKVDRGMVLFAVSTVSNFAKGAHYVDAYYSLSNGVIHRLIGKGDIVPGTTNVVTDIGLSKIFGGLPYLYCAHTGGVGSIVRFDNGVGTNLCFTGSEPIGGGPLIKRIIDYNIVTPDTIDLMTLGDFPPGRADPILLHYRSINGEIRYLKTITFPGDKGPVPVITAVVNDGDELAVLINGNAGARTTVYRYRNDIANRVFSWTIDSGETINGVAVTIIDNFSMHQGNLVMKMNSQSNGVLYGFLPRGRKDYPIAFSLDKTIYGLDLTSWGINIKQNSFVVETEKGLHQVRIVLPKANINAADFDGDGISDLSLFEDEIATWFNLNSSNGFNTTGFGYQGINAVPNDYDGDDFADTSVYDPVSGMWYRLFSSDKNLRTKQFGYPGVKPVAEDYDGDGLADIAVYDESIGMWYILASKKGFMVKQFGYPGTDAVPHDYDGDQITDLAVYDRTNGMWYRMGSTFGFRADQFGYSGAVPKPSDFDGDGKADICVFDSNNGNWYKMRTTAGFNIAHFGYRGVEAIIADVDGDKKSDLTVFDPRIGKWYFMGSLKGYGEKQY